MNEEKYLFRRQFVLGPERMSIFPHWKSLQVENGLYLASHPDLTVCSSTYKSNTIILLGYILDPYNPYWSDEDIITNIVQKSKSVEDIPDHIYQYCGRFVLIVSIDGEIRIFHDPGGLRQIYYYIDSENRCWLASQPTILANHLDLSIDQPILADFKRTHLFSRTADYWFPGTITLYTDIKRLSPNHYFDMRHRTAIRYWPRKPILRLSMSKCIDECSRLLKGIIFSAHSRFKLCFGISSGLDSRLLLAASKEVATEIQFFTQKTLESDDEDPDIAIPRRLMEKLGLKHKIVPNSEDLPPDFETMLTRNIMAAKKFKGINVYSIKSHLMKDEDDFMVVFGNLSEISKRDRFRYPGVPKIFLTDKLITEMACMTGSKIAIREFKNWLDTVKKLTKYNINVLDLMHWEHRVGSWAAMSFSEYDIAFDTVCPYNCRGYITTMLGVPFRYRTMPDYVLHKAIIRNLWPDVLQEEILTVNREKVKWRKIGLDYLYRTNLYDVIKYLYIMYYRRFQAVKENKLGILSYF